MRWLISVLGVGSILSAPLEDLYFSCYGSQDPADSLAFCGSIDWIAATAYNKATYDPYFPVPYSKEYQDQQAKDWYNDIIPQDTSRLCRHALKRLACVRAFPLCPDAGETTTSSTSYYPPCKLQCLQAQSNCNHLNINCDSYVTENCALKIPNGFFVPEPSEGPYTALPTVYGVVLGCWILMAAYWQFASFTLYKESSVIICKAVATIPLVKVVVLVLGTSFWATCVKWMMCSFWLDVSFTNTHLVYETGIMTCFVLVSKGWSITKDYFTANEWRAIIILMSAFYMTNSILLVLQNQVLDTVGFWIASGVLYGIVYVYILKNTIQQVKTLQGVVSLVSPDAPPQIRGPIRIKYYMFVGFLSLILLNIVMEIYMHSLMRYKQNLWVPIAVYEISNVVIVGLIGYLFRPQIHSPFFFMVPATINDDRSRPIPMIVATDEESADIDADLLPLLPPQMNEVPKQMIFVKNPNEAMSIGISMATHTRRGPGIQTQQSLRDRDRDDEIRFENLEIEIEDGNHQNGNNRNRERDREERQQHRHRHHRHERRHRDRDRENNNRDRNGEQGDRDEGEPDI